MRSLTTDHGSLVATCSEPPQSRRVGVAMTLVGVTMSMSATACEPEGCPASDPPASHIELKAERSLMREIHHVDLEICLGARCDALDFATKRHPGDRLAAGVYERGNGPITVLVGALDLDIDKDHAYRLVVSATGTGGRLIARSDESVTFDADDGGGCYSTRLSHTATLVRA